MSARDRTVLAVVAVAAAIAGFWFLALSPKRKELRRLDAQVAQKEQGVQSAARDLAQAQQAKRRYAAAYATIAKLGEAVPADDSVPSLIYQVSSAASGSRVDFRSLQLDSQSSSSAAGATASSGTATASTAATLPPGATVGVAGFPTMPFTLTFDGHFFRISDFLDRLQRFVVVRDGGVRVSGRLLTLDGISISAARTGFPRIRATIAATAFLIPPGQSASNGATASSPGGSSSGATPPGTSSSGSASSTAATATPPLR